MLYKDLLFYAVYGFLKWSMIRGKGFMAMSCFTLEKFVLEKLREKVFPV